MLNLIIAVFVAILAFSPFVTALTIRSADQKLPYPVSTMGFTGTLGGYDVQLNGSIQEIHAQMKTLYPDFDPDSTIPPDFNFTHPVISDRDLAGRGKYPGNVLCCPVANWGWEPCDVDPTRSGVAYLAGLKGGCNLAPYSCSRVSCGGGAGIWACNENSYWIAPSCWYLGTYATDLITDCGVPGFQVAPPWETQETVCGQEFDSDGYDIIVHTDNC